MRRCLATPTPVKCATASASPTDRPCAPPKAPLGANRRSHVCTSNAPRGQPPCCSRSVCCAKRSRSLSMAKPTFGTRSHAIRRTSRAGRRRPALDERCQTTARSRDTATETMRGTPPRPSLESYSRSSETASPGSEVARAGASAAASSRSNVSVVVQTMAVRARPRHVNRCAHTSLRSPSPSDPDDPSTSTSTDSGRAGNSGDSLWFRARGRPRRFANKLCRRVADMVTGHRAADPAGSCPSGARGRAAPRK